MHREFATTVTDPCATGGKERPARLSNFCWSHHAGTGSATVKLIVQIPCLNEEQTIAQTIADIPRAIEGVDAVEVLVIDDGCTDATVAVARAAGADHVISFPENRGLAAAWSAGIDEALRRGADIIVNTDADNQYAGGSIADLVQPIVAGAADMVIGARPIEGIDDFSPLKKRLQRLGSWVVRRFSGTRVSDATSGFRAYTRDAALSLCVLSSFTYTHETLIQAGQVGLTVVEVPIRTNRQTRTSRLARSTWDYVRRSIGTILRIYVLYQPMALFNLVAVALAAVAVALGARYLYFVGIGEGTGHVQSVIVAALLLTLAGLSFALGVIGDLLAANRKLLQEIRRRVRTLQFGDGGRDESGSGAAQDGQR